MKVYAKTDIGKLREINQDCYYIPISEEEIKMFIIADGMGGYAGGEVASNLAVFEVKKYIEEQSKKYEPEKLLRNAIIEANKVIYEKSSNIQELEEMGTTLDICLIYNNNIYIGHIGDSRIYKINNNSIKQITTDHSYVQKLVKEGTITEEEAKTHPKKNMIMKALGSKESEEPDIIIEPLEKNDIILMCTDGLTNMVDDELILKIIKDNPEDAQEKLIEQANAQGGIDNITLIIIKND